MNITWPPGLGGIVAIVVFILLLLLIILGQLNAAILAWCVLALAVAIVLR